MRLSSGPLRALLVSMAVCVAAPRAANAAADSLKIWVALRDKGPLTKATTARAFEDAPVHPAYLARLQSAGLRVSVALKWQNKVSGWVDSAGASAVKALPFVTSVEALPRKAASARPPRSSQGLPKILGAHGAFDDVFRRSGAKALSDSVAARGLRGGEGLRIAVMDENFHLGHSAFDSLFAPGRIVDQWDFVADASVAVDRLRGTSHGASVIALIAANAPGLAVGLAPYARYQLYRTENGPIEDYVEEDHLAAAFERAVDSGAQVINASLGYRYDFDTLPNIPFAQMDGRTRPASIAAAGAARRGALVVVAIGNEALYQASPSLTSPSDADSILSVGMIQSSGAKCSYSSTGNTADGRLKPEISAPGCGVATVDPGSVAGIETEFGTSVGAPVITGVAALLRQLHPAADAQKIRAALMVTGAQSESPDSLVGHGLVRADQAHCALRLGSLVRTPCAPPPAARAVKGVLVWRGGDVMPLPGTGGLDLSRPRLWDLSGRPHKVESFVDEYGAPQLRTRARIAPGPYILRVPRAPADSLD